MIEELHQVASNKIYTNQSGANQFDSSLLTHIKAE